MRLLSLMDMDTFWEFPVNKWSTTGETDAIDIQEVATHEIGTH